MTTNTEQFTPDELARLRDLLNPPSPTEISNATRPESLFTKEARRRQEASRLRRVDLEEAEKAAQRKAFEKDRPRRERIEKKIRAVQERYDAAAKEFEATQRQLSTEMAELRGSL